MSGTDNAVVAPRAGDHPGGVRAAPAPAARADRVTKRFVRGDGTTTTALDAVSLDVPAGRIVVVVGPRGSGKTTLLRTLAGLERPDTGVVDLHGTRCVDTGRAIDVPPGHRPACLVSGHVAPWPHLTALQTVMGPLAGERTTGEGVRAAERARRVLGPLGLADLVGLLTHQLTGAQRQRVALARALMGARDLVLFDDVLFGVDLGERARLRDQLLAVQADLGFSAVLTTRDRAEAVRLAHRLAVMDRGRLLQVGPTQEVYDEPVSREVATFMGAANELEGRVAHVGGRGGDVRVDTPLGVVAGRWSRAGRLARGDRVVALWRPERTRLGADLPPGPNRWPVTVEAALFLGAHSQQAARCGDHRFLVWQAGGETMAGELAWVRVEPADVRVLPAPGRPPGDHRP